MKRLLLFVRSVIPRDPTQLFLLAGSILLLICMQLRCFPVVPSYAPGSNIFLLGSYTDSFARTYQSWLFFSAAALIPIVLAGVAGLFICFWPGTYPLRRILGFVCLPALAGITAICARFLYVAQQWDFPHASVVERGSYNDVWALGALWSLGPALHMSVLGFALVVIFLIRLVMGTSSLPLSLAHAGNMLLPDQPETWNRIMVFVWISITGMSVIGLLAGVALNGVYRLMVNVFNYRALPPMAPLEIAPGTACLAGVAAWAAGEDRWGELLQFTRFPGTEFVLLGLIFPIIVELTPNVIAYIRPNPLGCVSRRQICSASFRVVLFRSSRALLLVPIRRWF